MDTIKICRETDALVIVDVQNDFMPGGALAVPRGDEVVPVINALAGHFDNAVFTKDWHPAGHISFASSHPGKKPFETITLPYGEQVLWPDHCVQGTEGAELHVVLSIPHARFIQKGYHPYTDSYSAFKEADGTSTGLGDSLRARGIKRLFFVGLATDYCVAWSAMDARRERFGVLVIEDAGRAIDMNGSLAKAWQDMSAPQVGRIISSQIP